MNCEMCAVSEEGRESEWGFYDDFHLKILNQDWLRL